MEVTHDRRADSYHISRKKMVADQLFARGIKDKRILDAFSRLPRHFFVEDALVKQAYSDRPLNIGCAQTISQPYIVALMLEALELKGGERILEIGSGCGYQTAALMELVKHVYAIERITALANKSRHTLYKLGYEGRFTLRVGDGTKGWPEEAPFDGIVVAAGAPIMPEPLVKQLKVGAKLVVPVGNAETQVLKIVTRTKTGFQTIDIAGCRFVKLIGAHGWGE